MQVQVDNIWASPSVLHLRVHVWPESGRWRRKYDVAVPLEEIPPEAVQALLIHADERAASRFFDNTLF